jgi:hypothetical protein
VSQHNELLFIPAAAAASQPEWSEELFYAISYIHTLLLLIPAAVGLKHCCRS